MKKGTIGIIGGMGPQASGYLYDLIIKKSIEHYGAKNNEDFPDIVLFSIPVPDFISNTKKKNIALSLIKQRVKQAHRLNISHMAIACNTAHLLLDELKKETKIPFISMIDETVSNVERKRVKAVGILGSPILIQSNLYQGKLEEKQIKTIIPSEKELNQLDKITRNVIKGRPNTEDKIRLIQIAHSFQKRGAAGLILACTELPLIFPKRFAIPVFNSLDILAEALIGDNMDS